MADHTEYAEPGKSDQSTYYRQHWNLRSKEFSEWLIERQILPGTPVVQIKDWEARLYTDHAGKSVAC